MYAELFLNGLIQGLLLALVTIGITIPYRFLNFPDLSAEGTYPLGGAITATFLLASCPLPITLLCATLLSGTAGVLTALIHIHLRINTLLAGIIMTSLLYSINLHIMGQPNLALFEVTTVFTSIASPLPQIGILAGVFSSITTLLFLFLRTEQGLALRAIGLHPRFSERQGLSLTAYQALGLFLGNACCGLAGSLMVQIQHYADLGMGFGIALHALAALMLGEAIVGSSSLFRQITAAMIGALLYQQIQGFALILGLPPTDLKLLTSLILLSVLYLRRPSYAL